MYETICKDRFDKMESLQNETLGLLRGHNGDPGLLDDMRAIKKAYKLVAGAIVFILSAVLLQGIETIWAWVSAPK